MRKHIAVSLLSISPESATGSFVYIKNLLDNLLALDKDNFYYLILTSANGRYFTNRYQSYRNIRYYVSDARRDFFLNPFRALLKVSAKIRNNRQAREAIIRKEIQRFIGNNKVNIMFFPAGTIYPAGLQHVKTITTVLDLQHEYVPNNFLETYLARRKKDSAYVAYNSDHIIAISNFTKNSLIEKYGISPDKVTVIYLAPQSVVIDKTDLKLPKNFIFYPAAIWPHKNHMVLVEAMNLLKFRFPDLHLIFTGLIKNKNLKEKLDALIASYGLKDKMHFLGFVPDKDLPLIYKNTRALVYPSSFEGFGIPLVEAFNYGAAVVAADNTSISEIVGDAGLLFETGNVEMLTRSVEKILLDETLRDNLIRKGKKRAGNFSWVETARKTFYVLKRL